MAKFIKSARFLAEDENGFVIGEADTYEEAQAFGGRVIDTQSTEDVFQSRKNIKSSQKGFENVAEETQYDDYHIDTKGQGILSVENIIEEIEGRGNQAVLTVQTSDGSTNHSQFGSKDWKEYKDSVNNAGNSITDVWVTEVEGGSYVRNSRRPVKSGVENLDKIKEFEKRYAKIKGDVDKEEDLIQYYVGRYGIPEETLDEIAFNLRINSSRRFVESTNYNNLEKELVTKILSGKLNEEKAARVIAMSKKCNLGYAKQILSTWIEERSPSLIKNGVRHVVLNNAFDPDGNIDSWSMDFVPQSGMADTKAGEILRAFNQIQCSWFNHGYKVGDYKGSEYVNSAARFLKSHTDEKISKLLESATRCHDIESYDNMIQSMRTSLENYLCNNSHLFQSVNEEDMWDEFSPEDNDSGELDDVKLVNGNSFIQFKNEDGSWVCTKINIDTEYNEGDTFTLEDDIAENLEAGDGEYGDFVSEGIHYSWESLNDNEYRINAVSFEDDYFVEDSDYTSDEIIAYCADNPDWVLCNKDNDEVDMDYFN